VLEQHWNQKSRSLHVKIAEAGNAPPFARKNYPYLFLSPAATQGGCRIEPRPGFLKFASFVIEQSLPLRR
jgi:hypothetical protein